MIDSSPLVDGITEQAIATLRKSCAATGGVLIVVDPVLADPISQSPVFEATLKTGVARCVRLPAIHQDLDPTHAPYLIDVSSEVTGERLVNLSLSLAAREIVGEMHADYRGRSMCAWVCGQPHPVKFAACLAQVTRVLRPDGMSWPLRLWDPRVLWHLPRVLQPTHWLTVSRALHGWLTFDPLGQLSRIGATAADNSHPEPCKLPLVFDEQAWQALKRIGMVNTVLQMATDWNLLPTEAQARRIDALIARCQSLGFDSEQDGLVFAATAMTCHEKFDRHPQVKGALEIAARTGSSLSEALKQFDEPFWAALPSTMAWTAESTY